VFLVTGMGSRSYPAETFSRPKLAGVTCLELPILVDKFPSITLPLIWMHIESRRYVICEAGQRVS
jgi:hypothetical protein